MRGSPSSATAFVLTLTLSVSTAGAQSRDAARADALFREGRALLNKSEYATACPKLEESYRLDPAPGAGINLGDCFEKLGKVASALLAYQAAFGLLRASDPRVVPVKQEIAALEKRVPRLTIKLAPGAPRGTKVKRDGRRLEIEMLGTPAVVNPGKHTVVVSAPGHEHRSYYPDLDEGEVRELVVDVGDAEANEPAVEGSIRTPRAKRSTTVQPSNNSQRTAGFLVGGAGLLGAAVAVGTFMYVNGKAADARSNVAGAKEDGERVAPYFYAATGVAVVGLALGGYLLLTSSGDAPAVGFQASGTGASAALRGTF